MTKHFILKLFALPPRRSGIRVDLVIVFRRLVRAQLLQGQVLVQLEFLIANAISVPVLAARE